MKRKQKVEEESVESPEINSKTKKSKQIEESEGKKKNFFCETRVYFL